MEAVNASFQLSGQKRHAAASAQKWKDVRRISFGATKTVLVSAIQNQLLALRHLLSMPMNASAFASQENARQASLGTKRRAIAFVLHRCVPAISNGIKPLVLVAAGVLNNAAMFKCGTISPVHVNVSLREFAIRPNNGIARLAHAFAPKKHSVPVINSGIQTLVHADVEVLSNAAMFKCGTISPVHVNVSLREFAIRPNNGIARLAHAFAPKKHSVPVINSGIQTLAHADVEVHINAAMFKFGTISPVLAIASFSERALRPNKGIAKLALAIAPKTPSVPKSSTGTQTFANASAMTQLNVSQDLNKTRTLASAHAL
jgi:enhancing lycopene biosynthesis protein 2